MQKKSFILGILLILLGWYYMSAQTTTIDVQLVNNTYSSVDLRSSYQPNAPVKATAQIVNNHFQITVPLQESDLFALCFAPNANFLLCLNPNENIKLTLDAQNLQKVMDVSGSESILFTKRLTDLMAQRQVMLDSINHLLQTDADQIYFSNITAKFTPYYKSEQVAAEAINQLFVLNDSVSSLTSYCNAKGVVNKKEIDPFLTQIVKYWKEMGNKYAIYQNFRDNVIPNYDFHTTAKIDGYAGFFYNFDQYISLTDKRNQLTSNLMDDYMTKVQQFITQYEADFFDGKLDKGKAKVMTAATASNLLVTYARSAAKESSSVQKQAPQIKTYGSDVVKEGQAIIEKIVAGYQTSFNEQNAPLLTKSHDLMVEHQDDLAALMFIDQFSQDKNLYSTTLKVLHEKYPNNALVQERYNKINNPGYRTAEGAVAPELAFPNPDGTVMKLSDLRGKIVLIDFWASWCGPCRRENPHVVNLYAKYHDKGFEVFSVSLDNNPTRWKEAIQKDKLTWPYHVSDLKGWKSEAAALYGVNSIPSTFLIDQEGRIIAKGLRGEQLDQMLQKKFGF